MENLSEALGLLVIGMIMVIIVLWLVVGLGNLVINLTNRFIKDEKNKGDASGPEKQIHSKQMAAIVAAVDIITHGRGKVDSVQKR
ncbi:MAG: OadG family protein [Porphyromonadaceae bacterium]|nr:OadG family protein [Porphyromonadaceae bacterium]